MSSTKNEMYVAGIVLGLVSLPMTWMTIPYQRIDTTEGMGALMNRAFEGTAFSVTGLHGYVNIVVNFPIGLLVALAVMANVLALIDSFAFGLPKLVTWTTSVIAIVGVTLAIALILMDENVSIAAGCWLGWFSAAAPLVGLLTTSRERTDVPDSLNINSK